MQGRVLVCEDDRFVRWAIAEHLRGRGYSVFEASDGTQALDIIDRSFPDAILLDLYMPKTDGFCVIRKLKERKSDIPVYVISGTGQASANTMASELGVQGFIKKPFRLSEINQFLNSAMSN